MKATLLVLILALTTTTHAGSEVDGREIVSLLYNGRLSSADSLINLFIAKQPDSPEPYFLKAHHLFYMRYFSQQPVPRDSVLNLLLENGLMAIELGEKQAKTTDRKFIIGSAYGLISRAYVMRQELWDAYWAAWKSKDYLEEVLKEDSTFYDAYIGLGVLEYYPSRLTGFQAALGWLAGMSGNREKGIDYFRKASAKGDLLRSEATFILAYLYRFVENDFVQANSFFSRLNQEFPGNEYFTTQTLQTQLAVRIDEQGTGFLESGIDSLRTTYRITNSGVLNGMAYGFLGKGESETALSLFKLNIGLYPDEANPYDSIAECYLGIGETDNAIRYSRIALEKLPGDTTISEEFRQSLREILEDRLKELGASQV